MVISQKDSLGNRYVKLGRYNDQNERWSEIINLKYVTSIEENRIGESQWSGHRGYRRGYNVYVSNKRGPIWINDSEYERISSILFA